MIEIIDAVMGSGKTTYIFKDIETRAATEGDAKFLYVSPFLSEVGDEGKRGRIHRACPSADFKSPVSKPTKRDTLKRLLASGHNVCCTHKLFEDMDSETADLIEEQGYEVIIDEALEVIKTFSGLRNGDVKYVMQSLEVDPESYQVYWTGEGVEDSRYADIYRLCKEERLFHFNGTFWLWELPPAILTRSARTTICTYMFNASVLHAYFCKHSIRFTYVDNEAIGLRNERGIINEAKSLITFDNSSYSKALSRYLMSSNGYAKLGDEGLKKMRHLIEKLVERSLKAKSADIIWTCFQAQRKELAGKGYSRSYLACNARATNDYRERHVGIYLVDRYPHTYVQNFLKSFAAPLNSDLYGLSEMIQWIWRLRIREGKPVTLAVPNPRMRRLLERWLDGEFITEASLPVAA